MVRGASEADIGRDQAEKRREKQRLRWRESGFRKNKWHELLKASLTAPKGVANWGLVWFTGATVGLVLMLYGVLAGFDAPVVLLGILISFVSTLGGRRTFGRHSRQSSRD